MMHRMSTEELLRTRGWAIARAFAKIETIQEIREYWLTRFSEKITKRVTWGPYRGQPNTVGFSDDSFQKMYRAAQFRWNPADHYPTTLLGAEAESYKTRTTNLLADDYYTSVNLYPPTGGFLKDHNDGLPTKHPLYLILIPLTIRGIDYEKGGLHIAGVDMEPLLHPGDAVIYDGSLMHGVSPVWGGIGRMQMHPIPCKFPPLEDNLPALSRIPVGKFAKAKLMGLENHVRIKLGMSLNLR